MLKKTIFILVLIVFLALAFTYYFEISTNQDYESNAKKIPDKNELTDNFVQIPDAKSNEGDIEIKPKEYQNPHSMQKPETNSKTIDSMPSKENSNSLISETSINSELQIIVKDEAGNLIENAKVVLIEHPSEKIIFTFTTKKDGQAKVPVIKNNWFVEYKCKITHKEFAEKILYLNWLNRFSKDKPQIVILVKGFSVKGVVQDTNGNLLEGVNIHLKYGNKNDHRRFEKLPTIQSKNNGVFEFSHVAEGKISFTGDGKGFLLLETKKYTVPLKKEVVLVYEKGREHLLKVVDIEGLGIAKATVICFFETSRGVVSRKSETDEKGFCSLLLTKEKNQRLIILHPEYKKFDTKEIYNSQEPEPAIVTLIKGNVLKGKVIDKTTAKPIPNAKIYVNSYNGYFSQSCISNSLGFYELIGSSNSELSISVNCNTHHEETLNVILEEGKENIKNFELDLKKVCRLKLIDSNSKSPIANKKVSSLYYWQLDETMQTNENGELNLPYKLNGNQEIYINLLIDGYANFTKAIPPTEKIITIEFLPSTVLQVFVLDPSGKSMDEMIWSCNYHQASENKRGRLYPTYNLSNNCFELNGLPLGKSDLTFYFSSRQPILASVEMVFNAENKISLEMKPPYLLIFKVKSSDNNVEISELSGLINTQDDKGYEDYGYQALDYNEEMKYFEYSFDSDTVSSFTLKFPDHLPINKVAINKNNSGVSEYEFVIKKGFGIEGLIMNENGQKITDATIEMVPANNHGISSSVDEYGTLIYTSVSGNKIKNQNGFFYGYGYTPGKYQIKVTHYEYISLVIDIELTNKSITDKQIILKKGAQISGTVSSANGNLAINAKMFLILQKDSEKITNNAYDTIHSVTDSSGQFTFKGLPMGTYQMVVESSIGYLENYEIVVGENQIITNLMVKLEDYLEITGIVVDEKDIPLNKIMVILNYAEKEPVNNFDQRTDAKGNFKFNNLQNIKYALTINSKEGYTLDSAIFAMAGEKNIKIILKSPKRILISGHVYLPNGKESDQYTLTYFNIENNQHDLLIEPKISGSGFQASIDAGELQMIKIIANARGFSAGESSAFNLLQYSGQPISITLKNKIDIVILVTDLYSRKPILKADGNLESILPKFRYDHSYGESDEKGLIKFEEISTGKKNLSVSAKGYLPNFREIDIAEKNEPIEILMGKGGTVKGQIIGDEKNIIANISIEIFSIQDNYRVLNTFTDENGNFEFKLVPPGKYYLRTEGVSRIQAIGLFKGIPITIEEGGEINFSRSEFISLSKTTKVNITLTGSDLSKKEIILAYTKPIYEGHIIESISLKSNEEGKASFVNVPMGEFTITVNGFTKPITMPITITSDQEINLDILVE